MSFIGSNQNVRGNGYNIVGSNAVVHGNGNTVTGSNAKVYGDNNIIIGSNAKVWGNRNRITGSNAKVMSGNDNIITGYNASILGGGTGNRLEEFGDGSVIQSFSVGPGTVYIAMGPSKKKHHEIKYVEGPPPADMKHDKVVDDDAKTCVVCLDRIPCCVAYPCMHACYCVECARQLCFGESGLELYERGQVKCAQCRADVDSIKRIFL